MNVGRSGWGSIGETGESEASTPLPDSIPHHAAKRRSNEDGPPPRKIRE